MKKIRKYYLVEELSNGEYKTFDSSFSLKTMKLRKELNKRIYKRDLKIISMEK